MLLKPNLTESRSILWEVTEEGILLPVAAKKKADAEEEQEEEAADDWEGGEEEWDPDFDEFDVPKSRTGKSESKEEDDLNFEEEEEFNDLFDEEEFDEGAADDY